MKEIRVNHQGGQLRCRDRRGGRVAFAAGGECAIGRRLPREWLEFLEIAILLAFLMSQVCKAMQRNAAKIEFGGFTVYTVTVNVNLHGLAAAGF